MAKRTPWQKTSFRPHLDLTQPYGFHVAKTVPSVRHLNNVLKTLDPGLLASLFAQSVQALQQEIPGLGARRGL